ncbi:MAG: hypothetical protein R3313_03755 [Candidatus Saccharimonadales bacterium]|nr:hypothetical protein [Candidatus Saccharimonadales bacterium]
MRQIKLLLILATVLSLGFQGTALAIGFVFPSLNGLEAGGGGASPTSNVANTIALSSYTTPASTTWGIDTGTTAYKVFIPVGAVRTITIEHACEGRPHGDVDPLDTDPFKTGYDFERPNGKSQTRWRLFSTNSNENKVAQIGVDMLSSDFACDVDPPAPPAGPGTVAQSFNVIDGGVARSSASGIEGHQAFEVYIVEAYEHVRDGDQGAGKGFRVIVSPNWGGIVTPAEFPLTDGGGFNDPATPWNENDDIFTPDYPSSSLPYALLDGIRDDARPNTSYRFRFQADCRVPNNTPVFLKWWDADIGVGNQNGDIVLSLREVGGGDVDLYAYTDGGALLDGDGDTNGNLKTLQGIELNGGANGSERLGVASFNIKQDVIYEVEWDGVNNSNALQFWLPFSEFNTLVTCPAEMVTSISGDCDPNVISGYVANLRDTSKHYPITIEYRNDPLDPWAGANTIDADDASPDPPGNNISNGFTFDPGVPDAFISSDDNTYVRVSYEADDGSTEYLWSNQDLGVCGTKWDYDVTLDDGGTIGSDVRAGDVFRLSSAVHNNGDGTGQDDYRHYIYVRDAPAGEPDWRGHATNNLTIHDNEATGAPNNGDASKIVDWVDQDEIDAGDVVNDKWAEYEVVSDPFPDQEICFGAVVEGGGGESTPDFGTDDEEDTSWDYAAGPPEDYDPGMPDDLSGHPQDQVYEECATTYNEQFSLTAPSATPRSLTAFPGVPLEFDVSVLNWAPPPGNAKAGPVGSNLNSSVTITASAGGSIAAGGNAPIINGAPRDGFDTVFAGGNAHLVTVDVDNNVEPGDEVCIEVAIPIWTGYSDGDRDADDAPDPNDPFEFCVVVAERPFFNVYKHDIWAGAVWDIGGACASATNPEGEIRSSFARINGNEFGGFGEYAAYAVRAISSFGTRDWNLATPAGSPSGTSLAFQNETTLGEINGPITPISGTAPPRCLVDYVTKLHDPGLIGGSNINSINSNDDETLVFGADGAPVDISLNNTTINARKTVVIKGDLYIRNNITYSNFSYTAPNEISGPSLAIVVEGNIYIDKRVTELNGLYIAQPDDSGNGGIIDTCSSGIRTPIEVLTIEPHPQNCGRQLTFNGAVVADKLHLRRTHGGLIRSHLNTAGQQGGAEEFIFNPMMYMHQPIMNDVTGIENTEFETLLIKDLPPIF